MGQSTRGKLLQPYVVENYDKTQQRKTSCIHMTSQMSISQPVVHVRSEIKKKNIIIKNKNKTTLLLSKDTFP